ncbi:hypothetical protein BJY01DRAFT_251062 [Aspergillus pseudoustus]|uniref:DUF7708 domain-containing protein n=1 Tax=Aspergillus pseudoustus TaxID=1810923 RepID=A0ABR4JDY9_9EURO
MATTTMTSTDQISPGKLVRRFTEELEPSSDLAIQTKRFQQDLDDEVEARDKRRLDRIYNDLTVQQSSFAGVEIARQALQSKCDEFFAALAEREAAEKKKTSILRFRHRSQTEEAIATQLRGSTDFTVGQVNSITQQLEGQWRQSHSRATTNFIKVCQKLDGHKQIFQWFPNQTSYTSTLCGAVAMVIQAAVSYSNIAEQLSGYVAELSDSIGVCTTWLNLYENPSMQKRLSDIYTQFFDFFIKVAGWYLKPKPSRWLDSFNANFTTNFKNAADRIKTSIQLIHEEAQIQNAFQINAIVPQIDQSLDAVEARIIAQVVQTRKENNEVGRGMYSLLMETARERELPLNTKSEPVGNLTCYIVNSLKQQVQEMHALQGSPPRKMMAIAPGNDTIQTIKLADGVSRREAERLCEQLQAVIDQVGGSDGIKPAIQAGRLLVEPTMVHVLGKWTQATSGDAQILWAMSPYEVGPQTSAQLAALGVVWTAIQAKAQFISYICQRPRFRAGSQFQAAEEKVGVLATVYSLIRQLLQFAPPDDKVLISKDTIEKLTETSVDESWNAAMGILRLLLEHTPTLRYCIISGINLFEGAARGMCQEFVDVLFAHVRNAHCPVRVLFTTSGQSRVLGQSVPRESKVLTSNMFHQMKGRAMYRELDMVGE